MLGASIKNTQNRPIVFERLCLPTWDLNCFLFLLSTVKVILIHLALNIRTEIDNTATLLPSDLFSWAPIGEIEPIWLAQEMAVFRQEWACQKPTQLGCVFHSLISPLNVPGGNHIAQEMPGGFWFLFYFFYLLQVWNLENFIFNSILPFPELWSGK